jgi:hypothetical protein
VLSRHETFRGAAVPSQIALLDLLTKPGSDGVSSREIARQVGLDHRFVGGFRAALHAVGWGPPDPGTNDAPALGPHHKRTPSASALAGPDVPGLNHWDFWVRATERDRRRFVDAVGLHHLYATAPPDHQAAFRRRLLDETSTCATPIAKAATYDDPTGDLSIPRFLHRALTVEAQARIDALVNEDRAKRSRT